MADASHTPTAPGRRRFWRLPLTVALLVLVALQILWLTRDAPVSAVGERVSATHAAVQACLSEIRGRLPADWSIERVLEQRVLRDGWRSVPECPGVVVELAALRGAMGVEHPLLQITFKDGAPLSDETRSITAVGKVFRSVAGAVADLGVEERLELAPLPVEGSPPPPPPRAVQLLRWEGAVEDYRTLTWPLEGGVLVLEIGRSLPGQADCPRGSRTCYRHVVTSVGWDGAVVERRPLARSPRIQWRSWDLADDRTLVALGSEHGGSDPAPVADPHVVGVFAPGGTEPRLIALPHDIRGLRSIEARGDAIVLVGDEGRWMAKRSEASVTFAPVEGPVPAVTVERVIVSPDEGADHSELDFSDGSHLRVEKRRHILVSRRLDASGGVRSVERLAELPTDLGDLAYVAADSAGRVVAVLTDPRARATSLLLSTDGGQNWVR